MAIGIPSSAVLALGHAQCDQSLRNQLINSLAAIKYNLKFRNACSDSNCDFMDHLQDLYGKKTSSNSGESIQKNACDVGESEIIGPLLERLSDDQVDHSERCSSFLKRQLRSLDNHQYHFLCSFSNNYHQTKAIL
jgi:hypothetical protein